MNKNLKKYMRYMCLASIAAAKFGFLTRELWFDHLMADEPEKMREKTWNALLKYEFFKPKGPFYLRCRNKFENIVATNIAKMFARGLGYKPVESIAYGPTEEVTKLVKSILPTIKSGIITDFKMERELRTNDKLDFMMGKNELRTIFPLIALKFMGEQDSEWIAVRKQSVHQTTKERRLFANALFESKAKNFLLLQDYKYHFTLIEDLLKEKDWSAAGKTIAFVKQEEFFHKAMQATIRLNGEDLNLSAYVQKLGGQVPAEPDHLVPRKINNLLLDEWIGDFIIAV